MPRFHVTWGTGPAVVEPFAAAIRAAVADGRVELRFRHRVDGLDVTDGAVTGVGSLVRLGASKLRLAQTGYVRNYALGLAVGAVVLVGLFLGRAG